MRARNLLLLIAAAGSLVLLAACRGDSAKSPAPGDRAVTVEKDGVKLTISPASGPVNSQVELTIRGVKPVEGAPFGNVSFRDSSGSGGEDSLTTDYTLDTRKTRGDGSLLVLYRIPANVLVLASPGEQNPTKKAPTSLGRGYIVFSSARGEIEAPFEVVTAGGQEQFPAATPVALDLTSGCKIIGGPDGGSEGLRTWVLRCEDSAHVLGPLEARTAMDKALTAGGWSQCGVGLGSTYYRRGDLITILAFASDDVRDPEFGKVYLSQKRRGAECP